MGAGAPVASDESSSDGADGAKNVMLLKKKYCGLVEDRTPVERRMLTVLVEAFKEFFLSFSRKEKAQTKDRERRKKKKTPRKKKKESD